MPMNIQESGGLLGKRFEEALLYATRLHAGQLRKHSKVPYVAHLLGVASLVLEAGGTEDEVIAALLHDAVEDQGGMETLEEIRGKFGNNVAGIVAGCTDSFTTPKPPWKDRKQNFIESILDADESTRRVALADKIYNAQATLRDLRNEGEAAWEGFNGGKAGTLWYYQQLINAFGNHGSSAFLDELRSIYDELVKVSGQ
jgi:(p)ppGpp synthase/HD superfamily hydrolase